jgi:hypothetical protein
MKKGLILVLASVNVALLLALVLGTGAPPAQAQGGFLQTDYLAVPCQIGGDEDALFIVDLAKQRLGVFRTNVNGKKIITYRIRSLASDFGKEVK